MGIEAADGASGIIAPTFKMSAQDWTDAWVPELLAWGVEIPAGLFLKGIGRGIAGWIAGIAALLYAGFGGAGGRDKKAALDLAAHFITHPNAPGFIGFASVSGVTLESMTAELNTLRAAAASGNWGLAQSALAFSTADVDAYFRSIGAQLQALVATPAGVAAAPPALAPSEAFAVSPEGVMAQVASAVGYGEVF